MGPCPPGDTHGDFFILYTLDERLNLPAGETRDRLVQALEGHIVSQGRLRGRYRRQ